MTVALPVGPTDLGAQPITFGCSPTAADGTPTTPQLVAAVSDPTVATLVDNGDGTGTVTLADGAAPGAPCDLDVTATDADGHTVSTADTGETLHFVAPAAPQPTPTPTPTPGADTAKVGLAITNNPNVPAPAATAIPSNAATFETGSATGVEPQPGGIPHQGPPS